MGHAGRHLSFSFGVLHICPATGNVSTQVPASVGDVADVTLHTHLLSFHT